MIASIIFLLHFQVDLEHNQYRSFQGLTCLMQISTRTEDFIVDTLKLRIYIGLYLQEPFKDPTKRKVLKNYKIMPLFMYSNFWFSFVFGQIGNAWCGSWYNVAPAGLPHLCVQSFWHRTGMCKLGSIIPWFWFCHPIFLFLYSSWKPSYLMFNRLKIAFLSNDNQASRVLQMERNSLEHLLLHFCGVTAKKE